MADTYQHKMVEVDKNPGKESYAEAAERVLNFFAQDRWQLDSIPTPDFVDPNRRYLMLKRLRTD